MNESLKYLTLAAVKAIHRQVLAAHGGARGIREETLLESAGAAPQPSMMGRPLISDLIEIAAAHLFYICRNIRSSTATNELRSHLLLFFLEENSFSPVQNYRRTIGKCLCSMSRPANSIALQQRVRFASYLNARPNGDNW